MIWPSRKTAERALSVNMLMPLLNNKLSMRVRKLLGFRQFSHLQSLGLPQLHASLHFKDSLTSTMPDVDVDGTVLVAVEKELVEGVTKGVV